MPTLRIKAHEKVIEALQDMLKFNSELIIDMLCDGYDVEREAANDMLDSIDIKEV